MGLDARKPVFVGGADQPAHPISLISAFIIRFLQSTTSKLTINDISIFWLVYVAEEIGLSLALSENPKTGFLATRPNYDTVPLSTLNTMVNFKISIFLPT